MVTEELFGLKPTTWLGIVGLLLITVMGATGNMPGWEDKFMQLFYAMLGKTAVVEGLSAFKKNDHSEEKK